MWSSPQEQRGERPCSIRGGRLASLSLATPRRPRVTNAACRGCLVGAFFRGVLHTRRGSTDYGNRAFRTQVRVINDAVGGDDIVAFFDDGTLSAFLDDNFRISRSGPLARRGPSERHQPRQSTRPSRVGGRPTGQLRLQAADVTLTPRGWGR